MLSFFNRLKKSYEENQQIHITIRGSEYTMIHQIYKLGIEDCFTILNTFKRSTETLNDFRSILVKALGIEAYLNDKFGDGLAVCDCSPVNYRVYLSDKNKYNSVVDAMILMDSCVDTTLPLLGTLLSSYKDCIMQAVMYQHK